MNLIILYGSDHLGDGRYFISDYRADHIIDILKLSPGDQIEIGLLNKARGTASVEKIDGREVYLGDLKLDEAEVAKNYIDIICALPRPQTLKKILFTSAMMNVRNLYLIKANRVEKSYFHSPLLNEDNYKKFLLDGLMQGKNVRMPKVRLFDKFKIFFEDELDRYYENENNLIKIVPHLETDIYLNEFEIDNKNIVMALGPEGGWVPFEIELMESLGFKQVKLGNWILRVEHALTSALAQLELLKNRKII